MGMEISHVQVMSVIIEDRLDLILPNLSQRVDFNEMPSSAV